MMICRGTMQACPTPSMCTPHQGCAVGGESSAQQFAEISRLNRQIAASQERVKALEDLVKGILLDLSQRAQLTDEPDLIDLSNGLLLRAAAILEQP